MNHNDIDSYIDRDLSALADASRRGLGELPGVAALLEGQRSAYRDDRPGAEARRDALAGRRHLELALMPLSLERVFVHRVSRAAAGGVAALCAGAVMVGLSEPALIRLVDQMIPGFITVTLASVAVALAVLAGYVVAGWVAERLFERHMRQGFEGSGDPYADLDALATGPIDRARALARRADGWAIGLPLAAVAMLVPLFAFLTVAPLAIGRPSFFSIADIGWFAMRAGDVMLLGLGMAAGVALAAALGRACDREHKSLARPWLLRWLGHVAVVPAAVVLGLALMPLLGGAVTTAISGHHVSGELRLLLAVAGTLAVTAPAAWALLWYRRREERRLATPAP